MNTERNAEGTYLTVIRIAYKLVMLFFFYKLIIPSYIIMLITLHTTEQQNNAQLDIHVKVFQFFSRFLIILIF